MVLNDIHGVQLVIEGVAAALRAAREQRGWTREQLADRAGISAAAIAQIESGRRKDVRLNSLTALAAALEISLDELTGRSVAPAFAHRALHYSDEDEFLAVTVPFLADGVERSERPLAVTSPDKVDSLRHRLGRLARHVRFAESSTWYASTGDALGAFREHLNAALVGGAESVRILGEPIWSGGPPASVKAWIRYESLINLVFARSSAIVICPYDARMTPQAVLASTHRTHPQLVDGDTHRHNPRYTPPDELLLEP